MKNREQGESIEYDEQRPTTALQNRIRESANRTPLHDYKDGGCTEYDDHRGDKNMRRKEKELTDKNEIEEIIRSCKVCRLGLSVNDVPYIVPLSFGYDGESLYFHTALKGRKIDMMMKNSTVCFEFESGVKIIEDPQTPCDWSVSFRSVIGYGEVEEVTDREQKIAGLNKIMIHYSGKSWDFTSAPLNGVRIWKILITHLSAKQSLDHQPQ